MQDPDRADIFGPLRLGPDLVVVLQEVRGYEGDAPLEPRRRNTGGAVWGTSPPVPLFHLAPLCLQGP